MGKKQYALLEALGYVGRFLLTLIFFFSIVAFFLFKIELNAKNYDLVIAPRRNADVYYGIEYVSAFEIWKVTKAESGTLSIQRIYPQ